MGYTLSELTEHTFPRLIDNCPDAEAWHEKRSRIAHNWNKYIGYMPELIAPVYTIHSEQQEKDHVRLHLSYDTGFGDRVTAFLLVPGTSVKLHGAQKKYPTILALHPTDALGKADIATEQGRDNRRYALELVARGYVVLAPDTITAGERIYEGAEAFQTAPFYKAFPQSTAVGKMIHDHQQGLELLQTFPFVDSSRIGAIGHSLGAYNAYFLAAVDDRIKAVVSSCGFCPFMQDPEPNRWGQRDWFSHIPALTDDINKNQIPFEYHEIMALAAPKPIFNWFTQNDRIFPNWQAAAFASLDVHRLYEWLGKAECYTSLLGNEGHDFPASIREQSYRFLDHWLQEDFSI
ncbi:dienelactone hydrolase family protein [Paenibacillus sp. IITD108]|uniref:dienelactone hydrolase family protein n=1 Tax=Paenibacillus sp. IITD108 TaxID=3116649 RepID=UPI002F417A4D